MTAFGAAKPIAIVTGFLGSGKTTLISRLLRDPDMADTIVIVNEFGEVGLDHHLIEAVTDDVILLPNGCLCCSIRQDIVRTLREIHKSWLMGAMPNFKRVLVETTGLAEPAPLVASIGSHPLLVDAFALQGVTTVVDAEHGFERMDKSLTNRNQICLADHLVLSKCDLVEAQSIEVLTQRLAILNPLAPIRRSDERVAPAFLFSRETSSAARSFLRCETVVDHLAGLSSVLLRPSRRLAWPPFQLWLNALLTSVGSRVLRIKGQLLFEGQSAPLIVQAVHHTFYPIAEAQFDKTASEDHFLLLVFEGDAPEGLEEAFAALAADAADLCRDNGMSDATFYTRRSK